MHQILDRAVKSDSQRPRLEPRCWSPSDHAVTYPVGSYSDAADRQVTYAYNIQGQQRRMVDQAGNVTTTSYDLAGRETSRAVGVVTGFVSDVQRIQTAYNSRGMVSTVTQYDAQSGGTALDEVAYAYDDWGNLTNFDQDADSSFGGSTSGRWGVAYSWEKAGASTTPNLLRRVCETLPGGAGLCYGYGSSGSIDSALSRVTTLTLGTTAVAQYEYRGLSQVAGTNAAGGRARVQPVSGWFTFVLRQHRCVRASDAK
jgi:hypothetical protein